MMPQERRLSIRKPLEQLSYLSLPADNGGIVLDVSEGGLGFRTIAPLDATGPIRFRFAIDSAEKVSAVGVLAWSDKSGKTGGLRFTELPDATREQIRAWAARTNRKSNAQAVDDVEMPPQPLIEAHSTAHVHAEVAVVPSTFDELTFTNDSAWDQAISKLFDELAKDTYSAPGSIANSALAVQVQEAESKAETGFAQGSELQLNPELDLTPEPDLELAVDLNPEVEAYVIAEAAPEQKLEAAAECAPTVKVEPSQAADFFETPDVTPAGEASAPPIFTPRYHPLLYGATPPVYSAPFNKLSLFPLTLNSRASAARVEVPRSASELRSRVEGAIAAHPLPAVGLTAALAFFFSIGFFAYLLTSPVGEAFVNWEQSAWGSTASQPVPGEPVPAPNSMPNFSPTSPR
jgi:hypothetical protein